MMSFRALTTVSLLGLLVTLAGCSAESAQSGQGTTDTANQASVATDTTATSTAQNGGPQLRGPHGGGPDMLLFAALKEPSLSLTDAQRATIQSAIDANKPQGGAFDKGKVTALAAGIRAGNVDATQLQGPTAADMAAHQAAHAKAISTLHDTLSADQRKALVAAVQAKMANGPQGEGHMGHGPKDGMGPMSHLTADLDLTPAQQDAIKAKLQANRPAAPTDAEKAQFKAQHEAMKAQMQTKLASFTADNFDATAFVTPPAGAKGPMAGHADHFAQELSIITSVLEPAQREKLAQKIEAGPAAFRPAAVTPQVEQQ